MASRHKVSIEIAYIEALSPAACTVSTVLRA